MNLGLAGVCNGTDLTSTFTPAPHHEEPWGTGKPGVKVGPGASRGQPARSLGREPQSLPPFHWPAFSGFLQFPLRHWSGAGFFSPSVFLFLPPPSPSPLGQERTACPQLLGKGGI